MSELLLHLILTKRGNHGISHAKLLRSREILLTLLARALLECGFEPLHLELQISDRGGLRGRLVALGRQQQRGLGGGELGRRLRTKLRYALKEGEVRVDHRSLGEEALEVLDQRKFEAPCLLRDAKRYQWSENSRTAGF